MCRRRLEVDGTPLEEDEVLENALNGELAGWKYEYQADGTRVLIWEPTWSEWLRWVRYR